MAKPKTKEEQLAEAENKAAKWLLKQHAAEDRGNAGQAEACREAYVHWTGVRASILGDTSGS